MRRKTLPALFTICCMLMMCACSSAPGAQNAEDGGQSPSVAAPSASMQEEQNKGAREEDLDPYRSISISATVAAATVAKLSDDPVPLEMKERVIIRPRYDLPSAAKALAVMQPDCFAVIGTDDQGKDCLYGGDIYAQQAPDSPLYVVGAEYPSISGLTGGYGCVYFVEHNGAAWRLKMLDLLAASGEGGVPAVVDHGEGPPPSLVSSDTEMVYAVETADGYELRVCTRRGEDAGPTEPLGIIALPQGTLEPARAYRMNSMGVTHVESSQGRYLAIAETLDGIGSAVASERPMTQALIGSMAVAWLTEDGAFCAYDPELDATYRYGEGIEWYAPRDVDGEGAGYLFGGKNGLYIMSWNLATDPLEMAVYVIAENDGWSYTACAAQISDINIAYVIRQQDDAWQLAYVELNEAFG